MSDEQSQQAATPQNVNPVGAIIMVIAMVAGAWWYFGGGFDKKVEKDSAQMMEDINQKVIQDVLKQYDIAKQSGSAMDRAVQAGLVKAAYLQAKDQVNYAKWCEIEKADQKAAGLQ